MSTSLCIANLPLSMDSAALEDLFTLVGNVLSARILREDASDASSRSLGRGFVEMSTREEAKNCELHFNGQIMSGRTLMVRIDEPVVAKPGSAKLAARQHSFLKLRNKARRLAKGAKP